MKIFVCRTTNADTFHLTDKEILNIKPTISKDGDAILIVNYYDFEDCLNHTIYCDRIDVITKVKEYPKTFRECQECLGEDVPPMEEPDSKTHRRRQVHLLEVLLICRDAYWKIAGDEMGLGKPWEPDWKNSEERRYCIVNIEGDINLPEKILTKWILKVTNKILVFPTEEMRDAFYENFKEEIEQCKELL